MSNILENIDLDTPSLDFGTKLKLKMGNRRCHFRYDNKFSCTRADYHNVKLEIPNPLDDKFIIVKSDNNKCLKYHDNDDDDDNKLKLVSDRSSCTKFDITYYDIVSHGLKLQFDHNVGGKTVKLKCGIDGGHGDMVCQENNTFRSDLVLVDASNTNKVPAFRTIVDNLQKYNRALLNAATKETCKSTHSLIEKNSGKCLQTYPNELMKKRDHESAIRGLEEGHENAISRLEEDHEAKQTQIETERNQMQAKLESVSTLLPDNSNSYKFIDGTAADVDNPATCSGTVYYGMKNIPSNSSIRANLHALQQVPHYKKAVEGEFHCNDTFSQDAEFIHGNVKEANLSNDAKQKINNGDPTPGQQKQCICTPNTVNTGSQSTDGTRTLSCDGTVYFGRRHATGKPGNGDRATLEQLKAKNHFVYTTDGQEEVPCEDAFFKDHTFMEKIQMTDQNDINRRERGDPARGYYKQCICKPRPKEPLASPRENPFTISNVKSTNSQSHLFKIRDASNNICEYNSTTKTMECSNIDKPPYYILPTDTTNSSWRMCTQPNQCVKDDNGFDVRFLLNKTDQGNKFEINKLDQNNDSTPVGTYSVSPMC